MSDIQIFIQDKDNEGEWRDIDEGLLDLSSHDAKVRADGYNKAIDDFVKSIEEECGYDADINDDCYFEISRTTLLHLAEQLKEGVKYEM